MKLPVEVGQVRQFGRSRYEVMEIKDGVVYIKWNGDTTYDVNSHFNMFPINNIEKDLVLTPLMQELL